MRHETPGGPDEGGGAAARGVSCGRDRRLRGPPSRDAGDAGPLDRSRAWLWRSRSPRCSPSGSAGPRAAGWSSRCTANGTQPARSSRRSRTASSLVRDGRICSVNRELCRLLGFERQELLGASEPFPFWAPEHHHEIVDWHAELEQRGESVRELTFSHRRGDRIRVLAAGRVIDDGHGARRQLVTMRDVSAGSPSGAPTGRARRAGHRRPGFSTGASSRSGSAKRFAGPSEAGTNVTVVVAELAVYGRTGSGVFGRPEALLAVDHLRRRVRAGDDFARTGDAELAWILPETRRAGGLEAIERWRADLSDVPASADRGPLRPPSRGRRIRAFALADRALSTARRRGPGSTEAHAPAVPTASDDPLHL